MKARKILMIMLTALTGAQAMYADDVSEAQARQIAVQMMNSFPQAKARRAKAVGSVEAPAPRLAYKAPSLADEAASPLYYVFNSAEADGGFVIVSGDDGTTTPVLGYSDHGSFSLDGAPENVRAMMERYAHQIEMLRAHPQAAGASSKRASRRIETYTYSFGNVVVEPFVKTKWNQTAPYNLLCPKVDGENPTLTGCVNTAEAQILNYWQWPKRGRGSNSYYWNPTIDTRFDLSGDFKHAYDWDYMLDEYDYDYTEEQVESIFHNWDSYYQWMLDAYNRWGGYNVLKSGNMSHDIGGTFTLQDMGDYYLYRFSRIGSYTLNARAILRAVNIRCIPTVHYNGPFSIEYTDVEVKGQTTMEYQFTVKK
ncbi:MAG: C10 family peptidase [Bacteroidaceae bacterium]|nr:C10 family peptidase [Bacteroidaceae bacterium]